MRATINHSRNNKAYIFAVYCLLLVLSLACNLPFLAQEKISRDNDGIQEGLVQNVPLESFPVDTQGYLLSGAQQNILTEYGYPNRFLIQFFDLQLHSGDQVEIRQESWYYDQMGYEIIFRNGEKFTDKKTDPLTAPGLHSTAYQPEHFILDMSLLDVLFVTGENGYYAESMPAEFIEDGMMVFLKGLSAGFENGQLRYVETLPLGNAGVSSPSKQPAALPTQTSSSPLSTGDDHQEQGTVPDEPTSAPTIEMSPTPEGPQITLLPGNALEYSQRPELIAYADDQSGSAPAGVQLAPFCQTGCFRYQGWLGLMKPGDSYEVLFEKPTTAVGVQFWGDPGDGIAHVYLDGEEIWEGNTEGTDANYPGGAFVNYLQISNLPETANHMLRIETDAGGGAVTMYFFGAGLANP